MAFDAGMLACTLSQIKNTVGGARAEKVYQPEKDEIILQMRSFDGTKRLLINAGSNNPRTGFTEINRENPQNPPMFCMLLRKYLQGAKLTEIRQAEFDRIAFFGFDTRDEMGFDCKRYLIAELMGKYSNLIFADGNMKIISALHMTDLSFDSVRQLIPGMTYSLPTTGDKTDPLKADRESFMALVKNSPAERPTDKFIVSTFMGIAPVVAREITFLASGRTDTPLCQCDKNRLYEEFSAVTERIKSESFAPCIIFDGERTVEYSFMPITQYTGCERKDFPDAASMLDAYFTAKDNQRMVKTRASDLVHLLGNAESRIRKKLELQAAELEACAESENYRKYGDMIIASIYKIPKKASFAELDDYESIDESGNFKTVRIPLDPRLTPSANAQRYYKKYTKARSAKVALTEQMRLGEAELEYLKTVYASLERAETPADLAEIREELFNSGYASRMKTYSAKKKPKPSTIMQFRTSGGFRILCGKNNTQNEYITHKLAEKQDYWFHARQTPGSHVILVTEGKEPDISDFTRAAEIAAFYSTADGNNIGVDYTLAKNVKKPAGAKPGFVIYHTNYTAYVTPNADVISAMREK